MKISPQRSPRTQRKTREEGRERREGVREGMKNGKEGGEGRGIKAEEWNRIEWNGMEKCRHGIGGDGRGWERNGNMIKL